MKISELMNLLDHAHDAYGDLDVFVQGRTAISSTTGKAAEVTVTTGSRYPVLTISNERPE